MSTASIFYDYIENVQPVCVTPQEFYRTIFAEGELQKTGVMNDGKFNAMIQLKVISGMTLGRYCRVLQQTSMLVT